MKNKKTIIFITFVVGFLIWFGLNFRPGSYPYAETYEVSTNEPTLINAINKLKKEDPEYFVPKKIELQDGQRDSLDYWYHIYFYFPDKNYIVKCWTRPTTKNQTTFAFIGINEGIELGHWKMINKDFSYSDNKKIKIEFENRILNPIKKSLKLQL